MSKVCEITVNVDEALSVNKYEVDEETPHIELAEDDGSEAYNEEFLKLVRVCPAACTRSTGTARSRSTTPAAWSAAPAASPARAPSSRSGSTPARRWASSTAWASICLTYPLATGEHSKRGRTFGFSLSLRWGWLIFRHRQFGGASAAHLPVTA